MATPNDCRNCGHFRPASKDCLPLVSGPAEDKAAVDWMYRVDTDIEDDGNCTNPESACPAWTAKEPK